jgi:hypothetical protein
MMLFRFLKNMKPLSILEMFLCLIIGLSLISPLEAYAGGFDEGFAESNNITFYDPTDTACGSSGGANSITSLIGTDNSQKIYNFWLSQGLTPDQSAGITGSMQGESGFSAFIQESNEAWPLGGYGVAQFTGGQRTAVTQALSSQLGSIYTQYYSDSYGGSVTQASGYIPDGVPTTVNDSFLLTELNYLSGYISTFAPSTIPIRVSGLTADYNLTIASGQKLMDYIKTLTSAKDVAEAWTYLYEQPTNIKATASTRAGYAQTILTNYTGSGSASASACGNSSVGVGGLTYAQAQTFMKYYSSYSNRSKYLASPWTSGVYRYQCTTLIYYFNTRFVTPGTGSGDGYQVASKLISGHPSVYKSVTASTLQPFTIFSMGPGAPGHTGIILGIGSDGSIVVGEANISIGKPSGLLEDTVYGSKSDLPDGVSSAEHWQSVTAWESYMKSIGYTPTGFAAPINESAVISKVQASLGGS